MTGRVFTIPPGAPFLATLAEALLDGRLIAGRAYRRQPFELADVSIYLPTRRAGAALRQAFRDAFGGGSAMLPRILAISDVLEAEDDLLAPEALDLPPVIGAAERRLMLARLVARWRERVTSDRLLTPSGQPVAVPGSPAEALNLAADLLALLDQAELEGVDWDKLDTLVPDDYAAWWQLSLTFLRIATEALPAAIAERGRIGAGAFHRAMVEATVRRWQTRPPPGPVIIAGSTGSVPSTADLMAAVLSLPEGALVLPGLDTAAPADTVAASLFDCAHPEHTMNRLVERLGVERADIGELGAPLPAQAARADIVRRALVPAAVTDRWPAHAAALDAEAEATEAALNGVSLVVAANEAEEAFAAAVALRQCLENPEARSILVTPDRTIIRRVVAELDRFGIEVEDTAGLPLPQTPYGALALLLAEAATEDFPPVKVAAILGHPEARFGWAPARIRPAGRLISRKVLRGPRLAGSAAAISRALQVLEGQDGTDPVLSDALALAADFDAAMAPLAAAAASPAPTLADFLGALREALGHVTRRSEEDIDEPTRAERQLLSILDDHIGAPDAGLALAGADFAPVLRALIGNVLVLTPSRRARVMATGPIEARLLPTDRLVLVGLDEGVFPPVTDTGAWLSRPMRAGLGLSPPEVRVGLSAHDFSAALGAPDSVLIRSARRGGAPTVPTRFLQRLTSLIGPARTEAMEARGGRFLDWARRLDDRPAVPRAARPNPAPPAAARPRMLPVTDIETLIRDPYAVYAKRILKLRPLDGFGETPDFGTRGTLVHDVLADFAATWAGPWDETAVAALIEFGRGRFSEALASHPEVHALWWPRFKALARFIVLEFEARRAPLARHPEIEGSLAVTDRFTLTGRADRIDVEEDGRVTIIDFKTGRAPTAAQIAAQLTPQLPLEAVIARHGGFSRLSGPREAAELVHVVLRGLEGRDEIESYTGHAPRGGDAVTLEQTIAEAEARLRGLVRAYADPNRGYLSRARPFRKTDRGDYDHLARVSEWSIEDDGGEE
ncbi:Double-strand break repair protein AddB [uncultured Pleomorphomonas sp.]|uniref:Double-strand break repair protein AddB n=1 Tax=uncultured Pleomorphomonas sp. TaxID=442121 RepID=A0A212LJH9_9HYPH|nr:double-strand break repair protein AddB [uncultured Pleomorphomonas sp.]SCM77701.1 Double-strand break repair protein AddB [uncultured Pleomorphomonas sp.]